MRGYGLRRRIRHTLLPVVLLAALLVAFAPSGKATDAPLSAPDWIGLPLTLGTDVIALSSPESTQEELPGVGHKFQLIGSMVRDTDPENAVGNSGGSGGGVGGNETISSTATPVGFGLAFRHLPPGIKITALENQLGLKYFFVAPRTCGGGSPRITLLVDSDGDGDFDFAAHGHVNPPVYTACPMDEWRYEDLTDDGLRWEVTPGGALPGVPVFPFVTWDALEAAMLAAFPNHKILGGFLVEDSCSFFAAACGKAYYDLVTIENRTLEIWHDTVRNG